MQRDQWSAAKISLSHKVVCRFLRNRSKFWPNIVHTYYLF